MIGLFVVFSVIAIIGFIVFLCLMLMDCHTAKDYYEEAPRIKYKQFVDWYAIAPDKWKLCDDHVEYSVNDPDYTWRRNWSAVIFRSLFDFIHYKYFRWSMTRQSKTNVQKKNMVLVLNGVQGDIDKMRREAEKQYQKGVAIIRDKDGVPM